MFVLHLWIQGEMKMLDKKEMTEYIEKCLSFKKWITTIIENGKSVLQELGHTPINKKMKKVLKPEIIVVVAKTLYTNYITCTENKQRSK